MPAGKPAELAGEAATEANMRQAAGIAKYLRDFAHSLSICGVLVAALFFAAALTPSLIPRSPLVQGALCGVALGAGYGFGVLLLWVWSYLELRQLSLSSQRSLRGWLAGISLALMAGVLWQAAGWQNSIRGLMGMELLTTADPLVVVLVAFALAFLLLMLGRLFITLARMASGWLLRLMPRRIAGLLGAAIAVTIFASVLNGVIFRVALDVMDSSQQKLDALIAPDVPAPGEPGKVGSSASLINWNDLGFQGRSYISSGPTRASLEAFLGTAAKEPIRVFAGLNSATGTDARANLALAELIRVGGFDRSILVVAVPTGTGWMDPAAVDTLEYLQRGDVATVAMQYSYLQSYLSLLVQPDDSLESGRTLFRAVYNHWLTLPRETRPRLYLYGLSLGAYSSQNSVRLHEIIGEPISGALWVGPPFVSQLWKSVTNERQNGTPAWLPQFETADIIRFYNGRNDLGAKGAAWGPLRIVYLQYASDPVVFFEPSSAFRKPAWMEPPLGPDVSPELRWYPLVSFLQSLFDIALAVVVPTGHGHVYSHADHIQPWISVTQPEGWTDDEISRLRKHLEDSSQPAR